MECALQISLSHSIKHARSPTASSPPGALPFVFCQVIYPFHVSNIWTESYRLKYVLESFELLVMILGPRRPIGHIKHQGRCQQQLDHSWSLHLSGRHIPPASKRHCGPFSSHEIWPGIQELMTIHCTKKSHWKGRGWLARICDETRLLGTHVLNDASMSGSALKITSFGWKTSTPPLSHKWGTGTPFSVLVWT